MADNVVAIGSRLRFGHPIDHAKDPATGARLGAGPSGDVVALEARDGCKKLTAALDINPRPALSEFGAQAGEDLNFLFFNGTPFSEK